MNSSINSSSAFGLLMSTSYLQSRVSGLTKICQNLGGIMVNLVLSKYAVQNNIWCLYKRHILLRGIIPYIVSMSLTTHSTLALVTQSKIILDSNVVPSFL